MSATSRAARAGSRRGTTTHDATGAAEHHLSPGRAWLIRHRSPRRKHHARPASMRKEPAVNRLEAPFASRVGQPQPGNDCWPWQGTRDSDGYGIYCRGGKQFRAHRVAYEHMVGPIPDGLVIDHLCRNPSCVNPAHMEPVTPRVNTLRGIGPSALHAVKTHCPQGHAYEGRNVYIRPDNGARQCRECRNESHRKRRARRAFAA